MNNIKQLERLLKYYKENITGTFKGVFSHKTLNINIYYIFRHNKFKGNEFLSFYYEIGNSKYEKDFKTLKDFVKFFENLGGI